MTQSFFVISLFINSRRILESDFTETIAKNKLDQLMLQGGTGMSYKTRDAALTWLIINMTRFVDLRAVYI
jgi:molybdopterin biosynthesis enzyme MoaB